MENILRNSHHNFNNYAKFLLLGHINGLAWEARKNKQKLIKAATVALKAKLAGNKPQLKHSIRHRLLAYAFLTGKSYLACESKCSEKPSASSIHAVITALGPLWHPTTMYRYVVNLEDIQSWLENKMS